VFKSSIFRGNKLFHQIKVNRCCSILAGAKKTAEGSSSKQRRKKTEKYPRQEMWEIRK